MSDFTPNNPGSDSVDNSGSNENSNLKYEMISAYIDKEIKDAGENENIKNKIESDNDYYNRYIFEKLTKENLQKHSLRIETPPYLYKSVSKGIDDYINKVSSGKRSVIAENTSDIYSRQMNIEKSNLKKYFLYSSVAFVLLVVAAFLFNGYLKKNPEGRENDLVAVSRNIFDKVQKGQKTMHFQSVNAKELEDSMNKYLDFKVFIPDVKEAILIGGDCEVINGEKIAHIIHKKGTIIIYTLQASKKDVMTNEDKIILCDEFKENVSHGKNWFPCTKDKSKTTIVWFKDNVICSSIADMDSTELKGTLSNYK